MISRPAPGLLFLVLVGTLLLQAPREAPAEAATSFRPALVGNGPKSLVNLIDTQKLLAKGQGDGVVMFDASIEDDPAGSVRWIWCHAAPGSEVLKEEITKKLRQAVFVPALVDGKPVEVYFHGTAIFAVRGGRPYLRVFANQNPNALAQESDLIEPQMRHGSSDWAKAKPLLEVVRKHARVGHATVSITVDSAGKMRDLRVVREEPAKLNIGAAALIYYAPAKFIPAFRDGKPVDCTFERDWAVRGFRYRR